MLRAILVVGCLLLGTCACGPGAKGRALASGRLVDVRIDPGKELGPMFFVDVDERSTCLWVRTSGATSDVELYLRQGEPPRPDEGLYDAWSASSWIDEELLLEASDGLAPGRWYVLPLAPRFGWSQASSEPTRLRLSVELCAPPAGELELDVKLGAELERARGLRAVFRLALPAGAPRMGNLRVEAFSPFADVDLVVGPTPDGRTLREPLAESLSLRTFERLRLDLAELSAAGGDLFVHVFAYPSSESYETLPVQVLATLHGGPELTLAPACLPPPVPGDPTARAVAATISIAGPLGGGSGVVISPDGFVITNAHVVVGSEAPTGELPQLAGGFTLDPARPPVHTFGLRLVEAREDLDLALLRIDSTVDGQALPEGLVFPTVPLSEKRLPLGTPLIVIGYPMTGGSSSMTSITLTQGVLSGYSAEPEGVIYKTDAAVHAGVSGGACIDLAGRLAGLPVASIADANAAGGLGFVIPVDRIPAAWYETLRR